MDRFVRPLEECPWRTSLVLGLLAGVGSHIVSVADGHEFFSEALPNSVAVGLLATIAFRLVASMNPAELLGLARGVDGRNPANRP